jgi:CspA family cold shock protein
MPKRPHAFGASSAGPAIQATVKWYNPEKGFGFVGLPTGGDAFLHVSVVERNGNSTVLPGATLEVRAAPSQKGHANNRDPECRCQHGAE